MTPVEELHALYEKWRCLSQEEGVAIERHDWNQLDQCHRGKAQLQARIVEVSQRIDPAALEQNFRPVVEGLTVLERRNQDRLSTRQQNAEAQRQRLDRSMRHLRQLHQSYVPALRANWQSYS